MRLSVSQKKEALQNALVSFKFPSKYFIKSDEIQGKTFTLASNGENGSVNIHSNYMSYECFNCYLRGYYDKKVNRF